MTAIEPIPEPTTTTKPWNDLHDELKTRNPKVREPMVAAFAVALKPPWERWVRDSTSSRCRQNLPCQPTPVV